MSTFAHFLGAPADYFRSIADPRRPRHAGALLYSVAGCLFAGILMFLTRLGARRQIGLRLNTVATAQLFQTLFGDDKVPHGDTVRDLYVQLDERAVEEKHLRFVENLINAKVLYPWRLLDAYYTVALDATQIFCYAKRHCPH